MRGVWWSSHRRARRAHCHESPRLPDGIEADPSGSGFLCPGHGAQFNAAGQWVGGQRTSNMRSYSTTYDAAAGTITIG